MSTTLLNFTIDDSSPTFSYTPYADGFLQGGWQAWFSASGFETNPEGGEESIGNSYHLSNFSGASVSFQFHGSAVYLYGNSSSPYDVILDGNSSLHDQLPSSGDLLFSAQDLADGMHTVNLTARPSDAGQQLAFDRAVISDTVPDQTTSLTVDNQNSTVLQYRGNWGNTTDPQVPDKEHPAPFYATTSSGAAVSLNFTGAVALAVNASTNYGHGLYNVTLDGVSTQYNASTWWLVGNTMLAFQSGLDPSSTHNLEIINTGGNSYKLTLSSITLYGNNMTVGPSVPARVSNTTTIQMSPSSASTGNHPSSVSDVNTKHTNVGVIVGPVIAGVVLMLLALTLLVLRCRKSRRRAILATTPSPYAEPAPSVPHLSRSAREKLMISQSASTPQPLPYSSNLDNQVCEVRGPGRDVTMTNSSSRTGPGPHASSSGHQAPSNHASAGAEVDVNRIIELIAQRIDRAAPLRPDPEAPPPRYPDNLQYTS